MDKIELARALMSQTIFFDSDEKGVFATAEDLDFVIRVRGLDAGCHPLDYFAENTFEECLDSLIAAIKPLRNTKKAKIADSIKFCQWCSENVELVTDYVHAAYNIEAAALDLVQNVLVYAYEHEDNELIWDVFDETRYGFSDIEIAAMCRREDL